MQSKKGTPAAVERWEKASRQQGCIVHHEKESCNHGQAECHHIIGKQQPRKIGLVTEKAGAWFLVPVCRCHHLMLGNAEGRDKISLELFDKVLDGRYELESRLFNRHCTAIFAGNYIPAHIHSYLMNYVENQKR